MSRTNRYKHKPVIPKRKKPVVDKTKESEIIYAIKDIAIDWIEKPHVFTKFIFALIWIYFFIRIFITDIDLHLVKSFIAVNDSTYILGRALLFTTVIMTYWLLKGDKIFIKNLCLLAIYPCYPVFYKISKYFVWIIPKKLFQRKNYYIIYTYIDMIIYNIVNIKIRLCKLLLFCIAIFVFYNTEGNYLYISIALFCIVQLAHLYKRYNETFSPIKVFQLNISEFQPKPQFSRTKFDEDAEKAVKSNSNEIAEKISRMEYFLMVSEFSRVMQNKVSNILSSRIYYKSFIFKSIYSFLLAMVLFGFINYCLYKIDNSHFKYTGTPQYFEFFYYSFFTIIPDSSDIEPLSRSAKFFRLFGVIVGVLINILILIVLITVRSERYKENLQSLNEWANSYSTEVACYFEEKFGQRTAEGLNFLIKSGSELAKFLDKMRKHMK